MKNMDSDIVNRPIKKNIYIYIYIYIYIKEWIDIR
jgi:hypothetical protein